MHRNYFGATRILQMDTAEKAQPDARFGISLCPGNFGSLQVSLNDQWAATSPFRHWSFLPRGYVFCHESGPEKLG
jgi:hypothetical protein